MKLKLVKREIRYDGMTPSTHKEVLCEVSGKLETNIRGINDGFTHTLFLHELDMKLFEISSSPNYVWLEFSLPDETDVRVEFQIKRVILELVEYASKPGVRIFLDQMGLPVTFVKL